MVLRLGSQNLRESMWESWHREANVQLPAQIAHQQGNGSWDCGVLLYEWSWTRRPGYSVRITPVPVIQGDAPKGEWTDHRSRHWQTQTKRKPPQAQQRRSRLNRLQCHRFRLWFSFEAEISPHETMDDGATSRTGCVSEALDLARGLWLSTKRTTQAPTSIRRIKHGCRNNSTSGGRS